MTTEKLKYERCVERIKAVVSEQAKDEGLWFVATTITEAYLQQALRAAARCPPAKAAWRDNREAIPAESDLLVLQRPP